MVENEIDFSYLNSAVKNDEILKSKGKLQPNIIQEKKN